MPLEDLEKAWLAQAAVVPIEPYLCFKAQGLVLGAGTVLASSQSAGVNLAANEARLKALLASAYGRPIGADAIRHIRRATQRWTEGDHRLAAVHLALTRLNRLSQPRQAARRLFMAEVLMEAGARPDMIVSALGLAPTAPEQAAKFYNPNQPRVPAGNGRISGQWANLARSLFEGLTRKALLRLALIAARFSAPAVFLGVLFIPTNKTSPEEEYPVPGHPGLRVGRLVGETGWRVIYDNQDGDEQTILQRPDGTLRDPQGQVVGRVLPNGHVAIDLASVAPGYLKDNEPRYCPAPVKDNYGAGPNSVARAYEDQVKERVNPAEPTPSGLAVALANPMDNGAIVKFDDCQHSTGMMVEAKGPTFKAFLERTKKSSFLPNVDGDLLKQATRQIQAAGPREVRWFFADKEVADHTDELFQRHDQGLERIEIEVLPYGDARK